MKQTEKITKASASLKAVAAFTLIAFIFTQTTIPAPTAFAQNSNVPGGDPVPVSTAQVLNGMIAVPPELGKIEESFQGTSGKTILFIQDAHDSLEAQENIAKLIDQFVKENGIKTVFEEGYEGPVPTDEFFGFIEDPKIKQKVSYFLLDKLRLGGAEYAHVNRTHDFKLIGVESLKLYAENIKAYQDSSKNRKEIEADLSELFARISILANRHFPKELKSWLRSKERSSKGELPLLNYLKELRALYLKTVADPGRFPQEYPALSILLVAEATKDKKLIEQVNALDSKLVFEEMNRLEKELSNALLQNDRDKQIFDYYQGLSLLKRLNQIQLTQSEYDAAKAVLQELDTRKLADFIVSLTSKSLLLSKEWERHIKDAVRFYNAAQSRDGSVDECLMSFIENKKEDTAALVFGGFHATAIKDILRQHGISYVVVTPRITKIEKRHQDYYRELMSVGHYPFEASFLVTRANKPPSIYFSAEISSGEVAVRTELRAITSTISMLGDYFDSQLIIQQLKKTNITQRSEMREGQASQGETYAEQNSRLIRILENTAIQNLFIEWLETYPNSGKKGNRGSLEAAIAYLVASAKEEVIFDKDFIEATVQKFPILQEMREHDSKIRQASADEWPPGFVGREEAIHDFVIGPTVLDIGANMNLLADRIAFVNKSVKKAIGVDIEDRTGSSKHQYQKNVSFRVMPSFGEIPVSDGEADTAVLTYVLHHVSVDMPHYLQEVNRVIRLGGKLIVLEDTFSDALPIQMADRESVEKSTRVSELFRNLQTNEDRLAFLNVVDWFVHNFVGGSLPRSRLRNITPLLPGSYNFKTMEKWHSLFTASGFEVEKQINLGFSAMKSKHPVNRGLFVLKKINSFASRSEMRNDSSFRDVNLGGLVAILKQLYSNIEAIQEKELENILLMLKDYLMGLKSDLRTREVDLERHITIDAVLAGIRADAGKPIKKTKFVKKIKGELSDIVNEEDVPVGVTEAGISHMFGLGHRTANGFVFTPTGKVLLQRRVHNKAEPKRLSIFGGHVVAGQLYADSMRREILEELGLDAIEDDLGNQLNLIGSDGQFVNGDPNNTEFRSLYSYILTEKEYAYILKKMRELDDKKSELTVPEFEAWIENEQRNKSGYGEVWGYQIADFQDLTSGQSITLEEQFKNGQRVRENVEYTSDLLLPLVAGNAPLRPGATSIHPMEEVKSSVERTLLGTPYYGIHLQQSNISEALRYPRNYYDVTAVVVKKDAAPYMLEELQDAKGRVIPLNSNIQIVDFSQGRPAEISVKNGVPVILVCIVSEDSEGVISSIVETLEGLKTSGVNVGEKNVSMILTGGLGSRNYPMTAVTGNGNKGLLKSINGESNVRVALQQSMQFFRPDGRGVLIFEVDKIMAISQPIPRYQEQDIQLIGATVPLTYEFLSLHPKVDADANGNVRRIIREKTDEERVFLDGKTEVAMYDNTGLYLSGKAANALVSKYVNAQGRVTDKKLSLHRGFLLKHKDEFSSLSMGFIDTGKKSMSVHIGDNAGYRNAIRQLFYDAVLRARMGVVIDQHAGAIIGREVILGEDVGVAPGAVILGKTVIQEGKIPGGVLIVDSRVRKTDLEPDSWLIGVEGDGIEPVKTKRGEIVSDVRINQDGRSVKKRIVTKITDDPKAMFTKPLSGIPWSWDQIRENLDLTGVWSFLRQVVDITFGVRTSDRSLLPYSVFYERYGFKKVYFEKILFGGGSSKIDESPFLINADGRQYVLRYLKDRAAVEYIVAYQMKLKGKGIPVPYIRRMLDGSLYFPYGDKIYYLEEMLDQGQEVDAADLTPLHYAGMGRMAARMHNAVEGKINPTGINTVRLRQVIGTYEAEYDQRYREIAAKQGLHTEAEQLFLDSYSFFKAQFSKFKQGYAHYLQSGISDIAIHGDLAYTNLMFDVNGEVVGIFDLSRAHNTKAIVDLIQVIFGRKNVGPIHFSQEIFRTALGAYQKEVDRKLGTKDVRALLEVLRSRFLEDVRNSLVNKEHRYYVDPSSDTYERRVEDMKAVVSEFKAFSDYANDMGSLIVGIEADVAKGAEEGRLVEDRIFSASHRSESRSLDEEVSFYQSMNRRDKGRVLEAFSGLIYQNPASDIVTLCMNRLTQNSGMTWDGAIAKSGKMSIPASIAALREIMLDPLTTNKQIYERLAVHYGIEISAPEQVAINRFIRGLAVLQDLILYKSRRPRTVGIMKSITNDSERVDDILVGKFAPMTGEIHPGVSCGRIRCRFCYNARMAKDGSMLKPLDYAGKENALSWGEIKRLVDDYVRSGVKEIYVSGGKEPWYSGRFKNSDKTTVDLIRYIREKSPSIVISMLTIGLELFDNEEARKTAVDAMNIIRVSLDSASPEGYDDIKGLSYMVKDGKATSGTFEIVRDGIKRTLALRNRSHGKTKLKIGMSFTCTENNYQELEQFLKLAQEWGVDFVDIKGVLANPDAAEKIRAFMAYIAGTYDRSLMGDFGNLNVYFHEDFFKKMGLKFDFDQELSNVGKVPEKCYLALSGIRTAVVIPNGRAFTCINSGQPGYDTIRGDEWDKYRLGLYKNGATIQGLVADHKSASSHINCRLCKHGTSTDENINKIVWKLERDKTDGFSLEDQPIASESDSLYYDGRAMYHKELSDAPQRSESREGILSLAAAVPFDVPTISESTVNVDAYVKTKLPAEMLAGFQSTKFHSFEIHLGTSDDTQRMLEKFRANGANVNELPFQLPYSPTGEKYYRVTQKDGAVSFVISAVRGRLFRFLAILKYLNVDMNKVWIRDFKTDWTDTYRDEISLNIKGDVSKVVICQSPMLLAERIRAQVPTSDYKVFQSKHIQYATVRIEGKQLVLINLSDAYGSQIAKVLEYVTMPRSSGGFGTKDILFIGEAGGIGIDMKRGDFILPDKIYEGDQIVGEIENADFRRYTAQLGKANHNILVGSVETIPTILSEDKGRFARQVEKGIQGVELELAHAVRLLREKSGIKFNAVLKVTDLPGQAMHRLGDVVVPTKSTDDSFADVIAAMLHSRSEMRHELLMQAVKALEESLMEPTEIKNKIFNLLKILENTENNFLHQSEKENARAALMRLIAAAVTDEAKGRLMYSEDFLSSFLKITFDSLHEGKGAEHLRFLKTLFDNEKASRFFLRHVNPFFLQWGDYLPNVVQKTALEAIENYDFFKQKQMEYHDVIKGLILLKMMSPPAKAGLTFIRADYFFNYYLDIDFDYQNGKILLNTAFKKESICDPMSYKHDTSWSKGEETFFLENIVGSSEKPAMISRKRKWKQDDYDYLRRILPPREAVLAIEALQIGWDDTKQRLASGEVHSGWDDWINAETHVFDTGISVFVQSFAKHLGGTEINGEPNKLFISFKDLPSFKKESAIRQAVADLTRENFLFKRLISDEAQLERMIELAVQQPGIAQSMGGLSLLVHMGSKGFEVTYAATTNSSDYGLFSHHKKTESFILKTDGGKVIAEKKKPLYVLTSEDSAHLAAVLPENVSRAAITGLAAGWDEVGIEEPKEKEVAWTDYEKTEIFLTAEGIFIRRSGYAEHRGGSRTPLNDGDLFIPFKDLSSHQAREAKLHAMIRDVAKELIERYVLPDAEYETDGSCTLYVPNMFIEHPDWKYTLDLEKIRHIRDAFYDLNERLKSVDPQSRLEIEVLPEIPVNEEGPGMKENKTPVKVTLHKETNDRVFFPPSVAMGEIQRLLIENRINFGSFAEMLKSVELKLNAGEKEFKEHLSEGFESASVHFSVKPDAVYMDVIDNFAHISSRYEWSRAFKISLIPGNQPREITGSIASQKIIREKIRKELAEQITEFAFYKGINNLLDEVSQKISEGQTEIGPFHIDNSSEAQTEYVDGLTFSVKGENVFISGYHVFRHSVTEMQGSILHRIVLSSEKIKKEASEIGRYIVELNGIHDSLEAGRKAGSFLLFDRLGLKYPEGVAILPSAVKAIAEGNESVLSDVIDYLLIRFSDCSLSVRSSPEISMPGILKTRTNVAIKKEDLRAAIQAVANKDLKMGIIVQRMVFGNHNDHSATGVIFSRNPNTAEDRVSGSFLIKEQGPSLVSGRKAGSPIEQLAEKFPEALAMLKKAASDLEKLAGFPQEIEFTIDNGVLYFLQTRNVKFPPAVELEFVKKNNSQATPDFALVSALESIQAQLGNRKIYRYSDHDLSSRFKGGLASTPGAMRGQIVSTAKEARSLNEQGKGAIVLLTPENRNELEEIFKLPLVGLITTYGDGSSHEAVLTRLSGIPSIIHVKEDDLKKLSHGLWVIIDGDRNKIHLDDSKDILIEDKSVVDAGFGINIVEQRKEFLKPYLTLDGAIRPEFTDTRLKELDAEAMTKYMRLEGSDDRKAVFVANLEKHFLHELLTRKRNEEYTSRSEIRDERVKSEVRSKFRRDVRAQVTPRMDSDVIVWRIQQNMQPAVAFVDAEDFAHLSWAQKEEYFFVALSNKAVRVVVYNERGQVQDRELAALLKLDRVERTDRDLVQAVGIFSRLNVPTIHLSKHVLPSRTSIGSLRKRVSFFKTNSDKSGTLATALLWAISGGEDIRMPGIRQEDGFWTVEESLLDSLQRTYDNNFVISIAA